jgi:Zn-dependent protease
MLQGLNPPIFIARIITLIVAFTIHEFAHAWSADQLGDGTPRANGRLTLNPLAHLDIIGSLMLLITGFGWAKPVPVNDYTLRRRTPAGMMIVSAAGPLSNLMLAILAAIPFRLGLLTLDHSTGTFIPNLSFLLQEFIFINLILLFFNLIPIFPLDGEKVAEYFLPPSGQDTLMRLRPYGPMILMALLFLLPMTGLNIFSWLVGWPADHIFSLLTQ